MTFSSYPSDRIFLLLSGVFLLLQPATGEEKKVPEVLDAMEVVGTRTERSLEWASPSISVFSQEVIRQRQWDNLSEALTAMPGVALASSGQKGSTTSLFTRGTNSDHTSVLLNGRRLNPGFSGFYSLGQIPLNGVTQIEVHRGATSTLWGTEGLGGTINLRTDGLENQPASFASVELGSLDTLNAGLSQTFTHPSLRGNVSLSRQATDNDLPNHQLEQLSGQAYFQGNPFDSLSAELQLYGYQSRIGLPGNRKSPGYPQLQDYQEDTLWMVSPGLTWSPSDTNSIRAFFSGSENNLEGYTTGFFGVTWNDFRTQSSQVDLQWDASLTPELLLTSGATYLNLDFFQVDLNQPPDAEPLTDNNWNSLSLFTQLQWSPHPNLSLSAGFRYDDYSDFDSPVTGKGEIAYRPNKGPLTLFGKIANAYSIPQAFDVFGTFGNPDLNAEEMDSYEAGLRFIPETGNWSLSFLAFQNDLNNLIVFTPSFATDNVGKARTRGFESAFTFVPNENLRTWIQYTHLEADNLDDDTRLARRPAHTLQAGFEALLNPRLQVASEVLFVADREDIDGATFLTVDMPDYLLARLTARYSFESSPLALTARIENLFDESYDSVDGYAGPPFAAYFGAEFSW